MNLQARCAQAPAIALLAIVPLLLASSADRWRDLGQHHGLFARGLANEQVRYGPEFYDRVKDSVERCEPIPNKLTGLDPAQVRLVRLFCEQLCMPWLTSWAEALEACDSHHAPRWCSDFGLAGKHLGVGPYFEVLIVSLRQSSSSLERYNIMAVIADRLTKTVFRHYPPHDLDIWVAEALSEYLRSATGDDVLLIARQLSSASFGKHSAVANQVGAYARQAAGLTPAQTSELQEIARGLAAGDR
jgi:hypothetical protein